MTRLLETDRLARIAINRYSEIPRTTNRVASRWVLTGTYHQRPVTLRGTTISRFADDGRIIEDHGHTDTISLLRQLGVLRTIALAVEILARRVKLPQGALRRS